MPSILAVGGSLVAIAVADRMVPSSLLSHLYCIPIVIAAVRLGMREGIVAALAATALTHVAAAGHAGAHVENAAIHLILYVAVAFVSARTADCAATMQRLATTDDLTGLHNLRSFEARAAHAIRRAAGEGAPVALLSLDVDRLKSLNDAHGHLAGADAVRTVGRVIGEVVPPDASACRYGGDEFVVLLPGTTGDGARELAERIQARIAELSPVLAGERFGARTLSVSIGVSSRAATRDDDDLAEELFREADEALYAAKAAGRGRAVVFFSDSPVEAARGR